MQKTAPYRSAVSETVGQHETRSYLDTLGPKVDVLFIYLEPLGLRNKIWELQNQRPNYRPHVVRLLLRGLPPEGPPNLWKQPYSFKGCLWSLCDHPQISCQAAPSLAESCWVVTSLICRCQWIRATFSPQILLAGPGYS